MNADTKILIENRLLPMFRRTMAEKYEMSGNYVGKALRGELPTKKIANKINVDYNNFRSAIDNLVKTIEK